MRFLFLFEPPPPEIAGHVNIYWSLSPGRQRRTRSLVSLLARLSPLPPLLPRRSDGASFSGDRAAPLTVGSKQIWFRGRRVLETLLEYAARIGMASAQQV